MLSAALKAWPKAWMRAAAVGLVTAVGAGPVAAPAQVISSSASVDWRQVASRVDRDHVRRWRNAWTEGLQRAGTSHQREIAAEGVLFNPDLALGGAIPPVGRYQCRVFKLGAKGSAMAEFTPYPRVECEIAKSGNTLLFRQVQGNYRPVGNLFPTRPDRAHFLGALILGDETRPMRYGRDAGRDVAGILEQIEPKRWRLVMPYPKFESIIDVIEIVPSTE